MTSTLLTGALPPSTRPIASSVPAAASQRLLLHLAITTSACPFTVCAVSLERLHHAEQLHLPPGDCSSQAEDGLV